MFDSCIIFEAFDDTDWYHDSSGVACGERGEPAILCTLWRSRYSCLGANIGLEPAKTGCEKLEIANSPTNNTQ